MIQVNKIKKEKLPNGKIRIDLKELKIRPQTDSLIVNIWEWVRRLPFYLEISKYSQALHQVRSKVNKLWQSKASEEFEEQELGYFLETNNIDLTKESVISLNSNEFSIDPDGHSIIYFANEYSRSVYEAKANIVLHSASQTKISQFLKALNGKLMVVDMPAWQVVSNVIDPLKTRKLNSDLKNYFYLNPTTIFKKFQSLNIDIPLYFYDNNHLSPSGHRLVAINAYNFLAQNNLISFQESWELINPFDSKITEWIKQANNRIEEFIKTDKRSYKFRGLFYGMTGDYDSAKKNLIKYIKKSSEDFEAYYLLGTILFKLNEFSSALEYFEKSFEGHYIEQKRYKYAYDFTRLYKEGWENYKSGDLETALIFANKLEKLKGWWWAQGIYLNFLIHYKMENYEKAEHYLKQGLVNRSDDLRFKSLLVSLKFEQKKYEEAISSAFKVLELNKNDLQALLIIGLSHYELGNKKEAEYMLSRYLRLDPGNQFAQNALSKLLKNSDL